MKDLKASELKNKSVAELYEMVTNERAAMYKARTDLVFRKTTDTASMKTRRHNIARMLTVVSQLESEAKTNA
ncbi:MAG: 50S ribosomal protein L29 [Rhabdochlamydiaceae bacterium]